MKVYAQFEELRGYAWDNDLMKSVEVIPYLVDGCGSDSVFILDGRNRLETMIQDCHDQRYRLRKVQNYRGFKIFKGERFSDDNLCIYESLQLEELKGV